MRELLTNAPGGYERATTANRLKYFAILSMGMRSPLQMTPEPCSSGAPPLLFGLAEIARTLGAAPPWRACQFVRQLRSPGRLPKRRYASAINSKLISNRIYL